MANFYSEQNDILKGELFFDYSVEEYISIEYQPSIERLRQSGKDLNDIKSYRKTLISFHCCPHCDCIQIFPRNTLPNDNLMDFKYKRIQNIVLSDYYYKLPENIDDVKRILENLPAGFIKDYDYGLGFQKDYKFIVDAIEEIEEIEILIISKERTHIDGMFYHLNIDDYHAIRKGINRINSQFQSEGRLDKSIFSYNALLTKINKEQYPEKHRPYKKYSLIKFISSNETSKTGLSELDKKEIVNLVSKNKKDIAKTNSSALIKLHNEIELITLENLIERFSEMLQKDLSENIWQKFFSDNPFILSSAFSYPIIKFGEQVCVGGRMFLGAGDKIADFIVKSNSTDNSALIEIKKPSTPILNETLYRGSVYSPTRDLSGAINQLLDQKYKFQQEITQLKSNSEKYGIESYSVNCLLIIGRTPQERDKKKSFELFRGNSKDIEIITFDELLEKLKQLHSFLLPDIQNVITEKIDTDTDIPF